MTAKAIKTTESIMLVDTTGAISCVWYRGCTFEENVTTFWLSE